MQHLGQIWNGRRNEINTGSPVNSPQRQCEYDVFRNVTSCSLVQASWDFGPFAANVLFTYHHDKGSMILWNVGKLTPNYMTSHIKRHQQPWFLTDSMNAFMWIHGIKTIYSSTVVCCVSWTRSNVQAACLVADIESSYVTLSFSGRHRAWYFGRPVRTYYDGSLWHCNLNWWNRSEVWKLFKPD
jgi:hypothetical protein